MKAEITRRIMLDLAPLEKNVNISMWKMMNDELSEIEKMATLFEESNKIKYDPEKAKKLMRIEENKMKITELVKKLLSDTNQFETLRFLKLMINYTEEEQNAKDE